MSGGLVMAMKICETRSPSWWNLRGGCWDNQKNCQRDSSGLKTYVFCYQYLPPSRSENLLHIRPSRVTPLRLFLRIRRGGLVNDPTLLVVHPLEVHSDGLGNSLKLPFEAIGGGINNLEVNMAGIQIIITEDAKPPCILFVCLFVCWPFFK